MWLKLYITHLKKKIKKVTAGICAALTLAVSAPIIESGLEHIVNRKINVVESNANAMTNREEGVAMSFGLNIGVNAIFGGFSRIWDNGDGYDFLDGVWKGALAGALMFNGKVLYSTKEDAIAPIGKIVHSIGYSIQRNNLDNQPIYSNLYLPVLPFNFRIQVTDKKGSPKPDFDVRWDVGSMVHTLYGLAKTIRGEADLVLKDSLLYLNPVFIYNKKVVINPSDHSGYRTLMGIPYLSNYNVPPIKGIVAHESIHSLQYIEGQWGFGLYFRDMLIDMTKRYNIPYLYELNELGDILKCDVHTYIAEVIAMLTTINAPHYISPTDNKQFATHPMEREPISLIGY